MQLPQFETHAAVEDVHWWFLGRRKILQSILHALMPLSKKHLIVDVGCGTGGNAAALASEYACIGVDPILEAIELAKKRYPDVHFICGYAPDDVSDEIAKADAVLLMDVLEHIEDDFAFVSTLLAAMKPGAYLIMMAPADPVLWSTHDKGFEHYRRYTAERLSALWQGLPVQELLLTHCNSRLYPLVKLARMRKKALGPNNTDLSVPIPPVNWLLRLIFATEEKRIAKALQQKRLGYKHGVSIFAVIQRKAGDIQQRSWPAGVPKDERPWMNL